MAWTRLWDPTGIVVEGGSIYATSLGDGAIYALSGTQWERIGGPGKTFVAVGSNLYGLSPDGGGVYRYTGVPNQWTRIGGAAGAIYGGDAGLFATNPQTGDLLAFDCLCGGSYRQGWTRVGGPGRQFAVGGAVGELAAAKRYLYGLAPDGGSVHQFDFGAMRWQRVGGAAASIFAGGERLFALNPDSRDIWEYVSVEHRWIRIGGPGRQFAVSATSGALYGLAPDGSKVWRYTGTANRWEQIGGAAGRIFAGSYSRVFATNPDTQDLWYLQLEAPSPIVAKPLDLVWSAVDLNGLPLNPRLGWQTRRQYGAPDYYPEVGRELYPPELWTNQITSTDSGFGCKAHAHVNWMAVTYDGYIRWSGHEASVWPFGDDDYNLYLFTPQGAGASRRTDGNQGGIQVEFDSDETIDHFHTAWWDRFHQDVDNGHGNVIDGKRSIVTALWGLDLQHDGQSELHPAFSMAMNVNDDRADDQWAMFVRTWGDEGYCSGQLYWLALPTAPNGWKVYKFRLPWRPGATGVDWDDNDFLGRTDWSLEITPVIGECITVTFAFHQGTGDQAPRMNGTLHLSWHGAAGAYPVVDAAALDNAQRATGLKLTSAAEQTMGQQLAALAPQMQEQARAELAAVVQPLAQVAYDNVPQLRARVVDAATIHPIEISQLAVRTETHRAKNERLQPVRETLRQYGIG